MPSGLHVRDRAEDAVAIVFRFGSPDSLLTALVYSSLKIKNAGGYAIVVHAMATEMRVLPPVRGTVEATNGQAEPGPAISILGDR